MQRWIEIPTADMTREEWVAARRNSIGGSDAAAIVGMNEYSTPFSVWAEKTGRVIPEDISQKESVRLGNDLEDYVAQRFMEATGKKVVRKNAILKNPLYPWAHANVDRLVVGEDAGLECKTTSALNTKYYKGGEFPERFYAQCMHYLAVSGRKRWYLAVLILGISFESYTLERDEDEIASLMEAERNFWQHVQNGTEPPMIGGSADTATLKTLYPQGNDDTICLFGRDAMLAEYMILKASADDIERQQERIKAEIQRDMGLAQKAVTDGFKVTWANRTKNTVDTKRYELDHPGAFAGYTKSTPYRAFEIKKEK